LAIVMRLYKQSARRIDKGNTRFNSEQGSIVVEASFVMPLILILLLVFIVLIRLCAVQMALHATASQAVRQIAAHIHPIDLALQQAAAVNPLEAASPLPKSSWGDIAAEAAEWLPNPAGELISSALRGDWKPLQDMAATELGRSVVEPILREAADQAILEPNRIRLSHLALPDLTKETEPLLTMSVEYEFPLKLPFYGKPILLRDQASERVWVSDAAAAAYGHEAEGEDIILLQIVSIEPSPLRPGRKATVVVKTNPGTSVSLDVIYKSGHSKAKHLGATAADESGYATWTWHVSGNTTPGSWMLTATAAAQQEHSVSQYFVVEKANGD
jgi:hypothetical protein